jgi:hypothetical protein
MSRYEKCLLGKSTCRVVMRCATEERSLCSNASSLMNPKNGKWKSFLLFLLEESLNVCGTGLPNFIPLNLFITPVGQGELLLIKTRSLFRVQLNDSNSSDERG